MRDKFCLTLIVAAWIALSSNLTSAQDNSAVDVKKFEVAPEFTTLTFETGNTKLGLGGRFTYNLNKHFALEAAGYFFPEACEYCGINAGRTTEGLFGIKVGKRFHKWGIFGKVRPGLISSSKGRFDFASSGIPFSTLDGTNFFFVQKRQTSFAVDVGGVLEFYPTKRIITRLDFGSTIIHYGRHTANFPFFDPVTGTFSLRPSTIPGETRGTLQFMAGVGFRF